MREFKTGATRDNDEDKLDFEGFLSPQVLRRFAKYMHVHRKQADGKLRASDNWQKGIPQEAYKKSLTRHFMEAWEIWRRGDLNSEAGEEVLCALLFNVQGLLFEVLNEPYRVVGTDRGLANSSDGSDRPDRPASGQQVQSELLAGTSKQTQEATPEEILWHIHGPVQLHGQPGTGVRPTGQHNASPEDQKSATCDCDTNENPNHGNHSDSGTCDWGV